MRRLLNLLTVLSLLPCVAVVMLYAAAQCGCRGAVWTVADRLFYSTWGNDHLDVISVERWPNRERGRLLDNNHRYLSLGPRQFDSWEWAGISARWGTITAVDGRGRPLWIDPTATQVRGYPAGYAGPSQAMAFTSASLDYWSVFIASGVVLAVCATAGTSRAARRRNQLRRGLCPRCGYDLRATPGRCPECGYGAPAAGAGT